MAMGKKITQLPRSQQQGGHRKQTVFSKQLPVATVDVVDVSIFYESIRFHKRADGVVEAGYTWDSMDIVLQLCVTTNIKRKRQPGTGKYTVGMYVKTKTRL